MSIFLSDAERTAISASRLPAMADLRWSLNVACSRRAANPGLLSHSTTVEWWHCAHEFVSDAALCWALGRDARIGSWLRGVVLDLARRAADDWIGPWFRDHGTKPPCGNLETAHLSWAVSTALDLAPEVFTPAEQDELRTILRERAMPMCRRWLDTNHHLANWRCILGAGFTVPAAVLGDEAALDHAEVLFRLAVEAFQEDGSYGESLQYSHYAMYGLMLAFEALVRCRPQLAATLPIARYARGMRWHAASMLYRKPMAGWGQQPMPRSANFNDSAALFACSADVALHIASRTTGIEAGLARWLFDTYGQQAPGVDDRSSFGFLPRAGFLAMQLLTQASPPLSPQQAGLGPVEAFGNGDVLVRDRWDGKTILAIHGGGEPLNGPGHLHGDLNSFILAHCQERLLVDPGHSCYRNLVHAVEVQSQCHNTLTFVGSAGGGRQEDVGKTALLQQATAIGHRGIVDGRGGPAVERGARLLCATHRDGVSVVGSDCAGAYGAPLTRVVRFWILCGAHALFIVDQVKADHPVQTTWNWLLNDRDGGLDLKLLPDRLVARRGAVGMKLFHCAGGRGPQLAHGWVHDAYHPLPGQLGEGASGSGQIVRWTDRERRTELLALHAIAMDGHGAIAGWHLKEQEGQAAVLEAPDGRERWALAIDRASGCLSLREQVGGAGWALQTAGACRLDALR